MTTILLLEDDVVLGQSLARALESAGLAVHIVCDGAGALSHLRDEQPDLVVVELMLPNLDGLSVCRRIRARSDVPIILLAPQSGDTNQIAALELGADDYIVKPVSESVVLARVRALLRRKDGARARHEREILRRGCLEPVMHFGLCAWYAQSMAQTGYPSDVSDDEWAFVAPYLTLMTEEAPQRDHPLRAVFNGLRWIARTGAQWRMLPKDLPPWYTVYQQTQRWLKAGVFEALVHDLRMLLREIEGRAPQPRAAVLDGRTLQSSPESGARAGYDGHKRRKGSKVHLAVDTLGQLLAVLVTPANEQERAQVAELAEQIQEATGESIEVAFVDQGYTGAQAAQAADAHGILLEVVKLPTAKRGFVLLPRRWVVERSFAWMARFRRLARDYERLPATLAGLHFLAFAMLMVKRFVMFMVEST